jgi:hypothetical protein
MPLVSWPIVHSPAPAFGRTIWPRSSTPRTPPSRAEAHAPAHAEAPPTPADARAGSGAAAADTGAPVRVSRGHGALTIEPAGDGALIRIANASAVAIDETAPRPILNPLTLGGVSAVIENGVVRAEGGVALEANGAALGRFNARHDFASAEGEARFTGTDLVFSPSLQPDQISVLARGVVANVEGPVDVAARLNWSGDRLRMDGALTLKSVAAATAGLGPIEGVAGTITFDDLAALTTPPHQEVRIAKINPGVVVRDGIIRFKLEPEATIDLESASFPFAKGRLSVQPTLVKIGAAETRYSVELKDVDVAQLIRELDFKDLSATGRVEGVFPLIVTPLGARIEKGVLKSAPGGGEIAYVGDAGKAGAGGPSQVAFDALRSFRYDDLALELSGDLDGDIITGIVFNGVNNLPSRPRPWCRACGRRARPVFHSGSTSQSGRRSKQWRKAQIVLRTR